MDKIQRYGSIVSQLVLSHKDFRGNDNEFPKFVLYMDNELIHSRVV